MLKKWILFLVAAGLLLGAFLWIANDRETDDQARPHFEHSNLVITRADGTSFTFTAEVANSPVEQAYGLMFVHSMRDDRSMIFPYDPPREVAFWMKNTLIPLDMLFVSPGGTIGRIAAEARPQDITPISSQGDVIAVIEIKGGQAKQDELKVGDKVESPSIKVAQ
jgi:uncharacterized membrane protein (UPF0127 family)